MFGLLHPAGPLAELRSQGYPVLAEDVPRLSPFVRHHISIDGHYSFHLPTSAGPTGRCATRTLKATNNLLWLVGALVVGLEGLARLDRDRLRGQRSRPQRKARDSQQPAAPRGAAGSGAKQTQPLDCPPSTRVCDAVTAT